MWEQCSRPVVGLPQSCAQLQDKVQLIPDKEASHLRVVKQVVAVSGLHQCSGPERLGAGHAAGRCPCKSLSKVSMQALQVGAGRLIVGLPGSCACCGLVCPSFWCREVSCLSFSLVTLCDLQAALQAFLLWGLRGGTLSAQGACQDSPRSSLQPRSVCR